MKNQSGHAPSTSSGHAIILVLILLAVGSLLITPALGHLYTGLRAQSISENAVSREYGADSAIQDALWQLVNGGFPESLDPYDFDMGSDRYHVDATVPLLPGSIDYAGQPGVPPDVHHLTVDVQPSWVPPGEVTLTYITRVEWQGQKLKTFGFTLPKGLHVSETSSHFKMLPQNELLWNAYVDPANNYGNYRLNALSTAAPPPGAWTAMTGYALSGPPPPNPNPPVPTLYVQTNPDTTESLTWATAASLEGDATLVQTVTVTGTPEFGVHYIAPSFKGFALTNAAAFGVATYSILIDYRGATYQVVVTYDNATGTFKVVSYQKVA